MNHDLFPAAPRLACGRRLAGHAWQLRTLTAGLFWALPLAWFAATASAQPSSNAVDFNRDIRPLLSDRCFACHGPDAEHREADLRLDQERDAKAAAIVPGKPAESELIARITSQDADLKMPPPDSGKQLTADEVQLLRRWIAEGAAWSDHWAYVPPVRHPTPSVTRQDWPRNWIDHFVLARLEAAGERPAPDADRITLIRRLYFDLIGLPPSPQEVETFLADLNSGSPDSGSPDSGPLDAAAYERLVDRLLASPHFGERLAMYWLDLVRYADTVGYHGDQDHNISPYRDWVIESFNDNLPFDRFTASQLAGDLLPDSTIDDKIASGYNRLLQTSHEGGVQPNEYLAIYAADRVRNVSGVWLGATMGCCQCHDHKYDPYTMRDFYSLVAFFADVDEAKHLRSGTNSLPTARPPELKVLSRTERQRLASLETRLRQFDAGGAAASSADKPAGQQPGDRQQLEAHIKALRDSARLTMVTESIEPRTIRILPRGNWLDESGQVVEPAVPEFLGQVGSGERRANRLDLARWLTDPRTGVGGLTARVQVNRFWYLMFGRGLAPVLDDFGGQGQPPTHPELLDRLAWQFIDSGWNVKQLLKLLVMSRTYQQSSLVTEQQRQEDPFNQLLGRQDRFRLPAEMVRDNALAVSGLLQRELGGPSVRPYQPEGYYRHLNFPTRTYRHDTDERQWRRGVYMHWQRQFLHPMLRSLDAPSREECTAQRSRSNTPLAALTMLNDPSFNEAARALAARVLRESAEETFAARLDHAMRLVVSRPADAFERQTLSRLLDSLRKEYSQDPAAARRVITIGLAPAAQDQDPVELAAWTGLARTLLNLNETITRN